MHSFVDQATVRGGALLLSGDAGVGKTALLDVAASYATAAGAQVVHATGAQFEANVSFAGLHQLLYPLLGYLPRLDEPQRAALRSALGLAEGPPVDRFLVSCATLELLTERPLRVRSC